MKDIHEFPRAGDFGFLAQNDIDSLFLVMIFK